MRKLIPWALILAGLGAYANIFPAPFIFDDHGHIEANPAIRHLWPLNDLLGHSSRPVVQLSLAVNYALGGSNPWGYHLFNIVIHLLAGLTFYGVLRRTFMSEPLRSAWGAAAAPLAGLIALLWLVHPLQTEAVTYTIQRAESMMGLFYLFTLYCVIRSADEGRSSWWKAGAVASCALAMGCKPVAVTAPVMVLLYDRVFLAGSWRGVARQRLWVHASLMATWLLLPLLLARAPAEWKTTAGFGFKGMTPLQYAMTQPGVIVHYLRLAFWPSPLCFDYGWPAARLARDVWPGLIVVGGLIAATILAWRRKPAWGFLGAWFFILLAPTSSFIPVADAAVEHRLYLPLAAVITLVTVAACSLARRWRAGGLKRGPALGWMVGGGMAILLAILTLQRNSVYRSELLVWQDTVAKRPQDARAWNNLGSVLEREGNLAEAVPDYAAAAGLDPDNAAFQDNWGSALDKSGSADEAIVHYRKALELDPEDADAHNNLGSSLERKADHQAALSQFLEAVRIQPDDAAAQFNLGCSLERNGDTPGAIQHLAEAARLDPGFAPGQLRLARLLEAQGRIQDAVAHYTEYARLAPNDSQARLDLGFDLAQLGRFDAAVIQFSAVALSGHDSGEVEYNWGLALLGNHETNAAAGHFGIALRLKPDLEPARRALQLVRQAAPP